MELPTNHSTIVALPAAEKNEPKHFGYIDALRGVAFLVVVLYHCLGRIQGLPARFIAVVDKGNYGVQLFYVASAFTLFLSLDQRAKLDRRPVLFFFVRRFFRIAPMFWAAIIFYVALSGFGPRSSAPFGIGVGHILSTFFFLHGWYPTTINSVVPGGWSIAVEMVFYALVPLFFFHARSLKRMLPVFVILLIISRLASWGMRRWLLHVMAPSYNECIQAFVYYWLPAQLPVFCLGFILFILLTDDCPLASQKSDSVNRRRGALLLLAAILFSAVLIRFEPPMAFIGFGVVSVLVAFSIAYRPNIVLVNAFTRYAGKVSYSGYLMHFFVLDVLCDLLLRARVFVTSPPIVQYFLTVASVTAGTLVVASLTYQFVEKPGRNIGRRAIQHLNHRRDYDGLGHCRLPNG
jgi:peptidoglycan/LPS O-acetylase OafA/YrhL